MGSSPTLAAYFNNEDYMLDPDHHLWDDYRHACKIHEAKIAIAERAKTEDARHQATRAAEQAGILLREILNPTKKVQSKDAVADILKSYLLEHGMCNATDIVEQTGLTLEELRKAMELLQDRIRLDTVAGRLKMWLVKEKYAQLKPEDIDEVVRRYMQEAGQLTVDDCARHMGIQTAKIRDSVRRIGFPRIKICLDSGSTTWNYYPHGTNIDMVKDPRKVVSERPVRNRSAGYKKENHSKPKPLLSKSR